MLKLLIKNLISRIIITFSLYEELSNIDYSF